MQNAGVTLGICLLTEEAAGGFSYTFRGGPWERLTVEEATTFGLLEGALLLRAVGSAGCSVRKTFLKTTHK